MTAATQLALPVIAFGAVWLALSPVALLAFRAGRPLLRRLEPRQQSTLLFVLACLPLAVAALVAILGFAPGVGGWVVERHCHPDVGCWPHVPVLHRGATAAALLGTALLTAAGTGLWLLGVGLRRSGTVAATLGGLADATPGSAANSASRRPAFKVIESPERWAGCVGWLRADLLVSRGLIERLSAAQLDAVLAHEAAHGVRLDNLRRLVAGVSLCLLPKRWRQELQRALADADERACDRVAAERVGGHAAVVDALLAAAFDPRATGSGPASPSVAERIAAVRAAPGVTLPDAALAVSACLLYAGCTLAAVHAAHHGSELLLAWLGA